MATDIGSRLAVLGHVGAYLNNSHRAPSGDVLPLVVTGGACDRLCGAGFYRHAGVTLVEATALK